MAIEVYQSQYAGDDYNNWPREAFELASFFSGSSHFTIIDSYTTHWWENRPWDGPLPTPYASYVGHRYKGDPIADTEARPSGSGGPYRVWEDTTDMGSANDWFVIQCETTIHGSYGLPKWQAKIQWTNSTGFDDVSGLNYGTEGSTRRFNVRFSPHGGWNLADTNPDFDPAGQSYRSSQNHMYTFGHGGSGNDTRWILVADDGQLWKMNRRNQSAFDAIYFEGYMGDIVPVAPAGDQPVPRVFHWGGADVDYVYTNGYLPEDSYVTGPSDTYGGLAFEDESGLWVEEGFRLPDGQRMASYLTQPNRHAADLLSQYEIDVLPYYLIGSTKGMIGTVPLVGRSYMPGFMLIANKQILCTKAGYGVLVKWDGSTDLNF